MSDQINNDIVQESILKAIYRLIREEFSLPILQSFRFFIVAACILFYIAGLPICLNLLIYWIFNTGNILFITCLAGITWCFMSVKALIDWDIQGVYNGTGSMKHWIEYGTLKRDPNGKVIW